MEMLLVVIPPVLFLALAVLMIVVSQVSGFLTFMRYSRRQKESNRMIEGYLQGLTTAKLRLSQRAAALAMLSAKLKRSNDELANLNNLKTRFLSMAVHDLRTPIGAINGYADLLAQARLAKKDQQYARNILVATGSVQRLMGDLTDLAIIEAGKLRIEKAPFEAAGLVSDVLATHGPLAAQKGVALQAFAQPGLTIVADRFRLGQVLGNLVGNAIKFTPAGGQVRVSLLAGGGGALFAVSDTGPGIHPSERAKIFDKFYQSKFNDPAAAKKGWGLGLAIASEIVRGHQGELGVESAGLGKGSKFWFFVPARPPAQPGARLKAPRALLPLACALLTLLLAGPLRAQVAAQAAAASPSSVIPIDDKARYDKFLEDKADSILMKMLGPNRAKVLVDSTLDFTRVEKFTITNGDAQQAGDNGGQDILFAWQKATESKPNQPKEFLPGIPMDAQGSPEAPKGPQSWERSYAFPGSFVKKLTVTIIIDKDIPQDQGDVIERVVTNLLDLDPKRGDSLTMIRATFAPAWKTIWYSQDSVSMVFKYAVLALMTMLTLIVIAWCFVKLAGAIETMAKAQTQQYAMDVGMKPELDSDLPEVPQLEGPKEEEEPESEGAAEEEPDVVIEVKPHQLDTLVEMLQGEDPENIALVSAYLAPEMRKKFLGGLPSATQAEVIMNMANVRFVEQEMVVKIKGEIERRLAGAVGGLGRIYDMIETAPPSLQRQLLAELETKDPALFTELRKHVLLMEDMVGLSAEEWSVLMGRTRIETWAAALPGAPEALKKAVEAQVLPQTWMIVSQIMESQGVTQEKVQQAQASILDEARKLIDEGKIHNPTGTSAKQGVEAAQPALAAPAGPQG